MKYCKNTFSCASIMIVMIISLVGTTNCFWTNPLGGESTTGMGGGIVNCPTWATYFEVINTTVDCNRAGRPFALQGDRFCEKICEQVRSSILNLFLHF